MTRIYNIVSHSTPDFYTMPSDLIHTCKSFLTGLFFRSIPETESSSPVAPLPTLIQEPIQELVEAPDEAVEHASTQENPRIDGRKSALDSRISQKKAKRSSKLVKAIKIGQEYEKHTCNKDCHFFPKNISVRTLKKIQSELYKIKNKEELQKTSILIDKMMVHYHDLIEENSQIKNRFSLIEKNIKELSDQLNLSGQSVDGKKKQTAVSALSGPTILQRLKKIEKALNATNVSQMENNFNQLAVEGKKFPQLLNKIEAISQKISQLKQISK